MILSVDLGVRSYDVVIQRECLSCAGELLNLNRKVLVVTDSGVPAQYAKTVAAQAKEAYTVTFPQGEAGKTVDTWMSLLDALVEHNFTRSDCVVAVGGGVVGDMSGFAAAAYLRLAEQFAGMLPEGTENCGFAAAVRDCFAGILAEERIVGLRRALDGFFRNRPGGVKLSIQGGSMTAFAVASGYTETLRQIFDEMGIADAYPASRVHRAEDIVIDAYGTVYPDVLEHAGRLAAEYCAYLEEALAMADILLYWQEMQFCREAALYTKRMEEMGYTMCLPQVAGERCIRLKELRDVSLARREMRGDDVVPNDVQMAERDGAHFFFVTGANGGGKTTYLRSLGIAVLFFLTGCPVAARSGEIWPFARLCTHFPSAENFEDTGRFVDEVRRAEEIRKLADKDTVALFNETFSGTDEQKSEEYSRRLADDMYAYGTFGLYVTHIHTLTHGKIPTLAAVVDAEDENRRTYRIRRMDGTDSSFAEDILKKYRLTEEGLAERLAQMRAARADAVDTGKGEGI